LKGAIYVAAPRRRIRWGRAILLLLILITLLAACSWASFFVYKKYTAIMTAPAKTENVQLAGLPGKRITILLLGVAGVGQTSSHTASERADALAVVSINKADGSIACLSIPRDTRVSIPGHTGYAQIGRAYSYGGADLTVRTVTDLLNLPIHHYVALNEKTFLKVMDKLGGIDLYVEKNMNYEDPYAPLTIHLQQGYQHLDGNKAEDYVRFCSDELGDIGRVERQQRFLKAVFNQKLQFDTLLKLPVVFYSLRQQIGTDMNLMTVLQLVNRLRTYKSGNLHMEMLPGQNTVIAGVQYWEPDPQATAQVMEELFGQENAGTQQTAK
jgi:LCP family protein required for cell wall assembly